MKIVLSIVIAICLLTGFTGNTYSQEAVINASGPSPHAIMRPDWDTLVKWTDDYNNAPRAYIDEETGLMLSAAKQEDRATSMSLLSHLDYTPSQRDQGYCGDCWVWAGTGVLEIADSVQRGIKNRHSTQFLNSCMTVYNGQSFYACNGGNLTEFAGWYNGELYSIPWSNTNASFKDGSSTCGNASSSCVSCNSIGKSPSYTYTSVQAETIDTHSGQATAIANIKNVLSQNKAVQFAFWLPTQGNWNDFDSFWSNSPESTLWTPDSYCGGTWINGQGGGHAILLVGYNDDDPVASNHYWIILNSWGTTSGRPTGLLRMPMNMNYDCTYSNGSNSIYSRQFMTLNVTTPDCTYTITSPTLVAYKYNGGSATVKIEASSTTCPAPSVMPNAAWLSYSNLTFNKGIGTVKIKAAATASSLGRTGTVTIGATTLDTTQTGQPCTFGAFTPPHASLGSSAQAGNTFTVTTKPADCAWTATADPSATWIQITSGSGTGGQQVTYGVLQNTASTPRTGKIKVYVTATPTKMKTFTLAQAKFTPNIAGQWSGTYASTQGGTSGGISTTLSQTGIAVSGTLSVYNTACGDLLNKPLSGTVRGNIASFKASATCNGGTSSLAFTGGVISADQSQINNGTYETSRGGAITDRGTFSLHK